MILICKGTARGGGRRGVQADSARLVCGRGEVREELLTQVSERMGAEHYGEERVETAEALAELIIAEELKLGGGRKLISKLGPKGIQ